MSTANVLPLDRIKSAIRHSLASFRPTASTPLLEPSPLRAYFTAKPEKELYCPLTGIYNEDELSQAILQGRDAEQVHALLAVAEGLSCEVFLASVQKEVIDYDGSWADYLEDVKMQDDDDPDEIEPPPPAQQTQREVSYWSEKLVHLRGGAKFRGRWVDPEALVDDVCFNRFEPEEESEEYENDPASWGTIYRHRLTVGIFPWSLAHERMGV